MGSPKFCIHNVNEKRGATDCRRALAEPRARVLFSSPLRAPAAACARHVYGNYLPLPRGHTAPPCRRVLCAQSRGDYFRTGCPSPHPDPYPFQGVRAGPTPPKQFNTLRSSEHRHSSEALSPVRRSKGGHVLMAVRLVCRRQTDLAITNSGMPSAPARSCMLSYPKPFAFVAQ